MQLGARNLEGENPMGDDYRRALRSSWPTLNAAKDVTEPGRKCAQLMLARALHFLHQAARFADARSRRGAVSPPPACAGRASPGASGSASSLSSS